MDTGYTGNRIASLRKEKGWTQKELAEQLHVTDKAVSKWERGLNYPDLSLFEPLADTLGTSVADLLGIGASSAEELLKAAVRISEEEKNAIKREFRNRIWICLVIAVITCFSQICVSAILAEHQIYGIAQMLTCGMLGLDGTAVGCGIYMLRKYKKL